MIHKIRNQIAVSTLGRSLRILPRRDRLKIFAIIILQICLGFLDLVGVAAIGVLGALAVSGVSSRQPGNRVYELLKLLQIENQPLQVQALILGSIAALLMVIKTIVSIYFTRKTLFFLSRRGAEISSILLHKLLAQNLQVVQERSLQQNLYALTTGVSTITVGVLGTAVGLIADLSLLIVMMMGLFVVDTTIAISTFLIFGGVGFVLYRIMYLKVQILGKHQAMLNVVSNQKIYEVLQGYREIIVRNRRRYYADQIGKQRLELADVGAEIAFMPNISKYAIEVTLVVGSLLISASQFLLQDAVHAVGVLSVFLAASIRISPAVLRLQQGAINILGSLGSATPTLELIESISMAEKITIESEDIDFSHTDFKALIDLRDITFTYRGSHSPAINGISLEILEGQSVAIVGPSGAGKSTLVDLLLGVLEPDQGEILISGERPLVAFSRWPGAVAYVPQNVLITQGTIRENVGMGYPLDFISDKLVWKALSIAQLKDFAENLEEKLDQPVGDAGSRISGGQRQRLGIARAMFTQPKLLVLDEATSALDGQTEKEISAAIYNMRGSVTVITIAHRLSTVRDADLVVYIEAGSIRSTGSFEKVRREVPDFDNQAKLMGL